MKKYLKILSECSLFKDISPDDILAILPCLGAKVTAFDKKYTILAEGNTAKYIGIMLSGSAQIIRIDYYGNRSIVSGIEAGDVFAEAFACAGIKRVPVDIIANELSEVMLIESNRILSTCQNNCTFHRQIIYNLMRSLAQKNIMFHQRLEITSKRTTREKLLAYLSFVAQKNGSNTFVIPFDRQELADYLEVDRSGLSAEISKLRQEGILESHRKTFKLL